MYLSNEINTYKTPPRVEGRKEMLQNGARQNTSLFRANICGVFGASKISNAVNAG